MDDLKAGKTDVIDPFRFGGHPTPPISALHDEPLHRVFKAVEQHFRQAILHQMRLEGIHTLFPGALPLVLHLGDEDGVTLSELGKRCGLESSTMTPLVDELEKQDIARRVRAPEDRRVIRVYLTDHGRELEPRLRHMLLEVQAAAFRHIPAEDLTAMRLVMEQIIANLEQLTPTEGES